jgi:hypothetical protein
VSKSTVSRICEAVNEQITAQTTSRQSRIRVALGFRMRMEAYRANSTLTEGLWRGRKPPASGTGAPQLVKVELAGEPGCQLTHYISEEMEMSLR